MHRIETYTRLAIIFIIIITILYLPILLILNMFLMIKNNNFLLFNNSLVLGYYFFVCKKTTCYARGSKKAIAMYEIKTSNDIISL